MKVAFMHMIRGDFQKPGRGDVVWLTTMPAVYDMALIPHPADGMRVVIYEPDAFAMHATLAREPDGMWTAKLDPTTVVDCALDTVEQRQGYVEAVWEVAGLAPTPIGQPRFVEGQTLKIAEVSFIAWFAPMNVNSRHRSGRGPTRSTWRRR